MHPTFNLHDFLLSAHIANITPTANTSLEHIIATLGKPQQLYSPTLLDSPEKLNLQNPQHFPVIAEYTDLEFHSTAPNSLSCVFIDTFSSPHQQISAHPLPITHPAYLTKGMPLPTFIANMQQKKIPILSINPYGTFPACTVLMPSGLQIGFEQDDDTEQSPTNTPLAQQSTYLLSWLSYQPNQNHTHLTNP